MVLSLAKEGEYSCCQEYVSHALGAECMFTITHCERQSTNKMVKFSRSSSVEAKNDLATIKSLIAIGEWPPLQWHLWVKNCNECFQRRARSAHHCVCSQEKGKRCPLYLFACKGPRIGKQGIVCRLQNAPLSHPLDVIGSNERFQQSAGSINQCNRSCTRGLRYTVVLSAHKKQKISKQIIVCQ